MKPLLLLDIDGVLNPIDSTNREREERGFEVKYFLSEIVDYKYSFIRWASEKEYETAEGDIFSFQFVYNPKVIVMLQKLKNDFELVWATTWTFDANPAVSPMFGLGVLETIPLDPPYRRFGRYFWKDNQIIEWAQGRPFIWFDDDLRSDDLELLEEHGAKGVIVDPAVGFNEEHVSIANEWRKKLEV